MNIGLFLPNWVGDLAMATPALRALRHHFAEARLIGILRPHLSEVLAGTNYLDRSIHYDPRSIDRSLRSRALVKQLRATRLEMAILFTHSLRSALLARASGARRRVGYARNWRSWFLTQRLYQPRQQGRWLPAPVLDDYLQLAYAVGCPGESPRIALATTAAEEQGADATLHRLGLRDSYVAINSSGAFGAAKLWPREYFAELACRIAVEHQRDVLVLCGPSEREIARSIATQANHTRVKSLADERVSLGLTKACIRRSSLLISTDSGPRHFAAAFDVPVVTLFGPTHQAWSQTYYGREISLQRQLPCGPCQQRTCPLLHHRCMRDLSVDHVYAAVGRQLEDLWKVKAA